MKEIIYTVTFHSEWHAGSGLTSGSDLDALVVKDAQGLPFIPGKTLKGLLREAALEILKLEGKEPEKSRLVIELFGYFDDKRADDSENHTKGAAFFSNAALPADLRQGATESGLSVFFYRDMAATAIGGNGISLKGSLRRMQTVIPCQLVASISGVEESYVNDLKRCMKYIKRLGLNRNRGLGRCTFEVVELKEEAML